jgi:hypothetical protein
MNVKPPPGLELEVSDELPADLLPRDPEDKLESIPTTLTENEYPSELALEKPRRSSDASTCSDDDVACNSTEAPQSTSRCNLDSAVATPGSEDPTLDTLSSWLESSPQTRMLCVRSYEAEADGYISVMKGDHVDAWLQFQGPADEGCDYPTYVYGEVLPGGPRGWLPPHVIWELYVDDSGRGWAYEASTGESVWEDELHHA